MLVQLGQPAKAAELLHEALKYARTTPAERDAFFKAHEAARDRGAWVDVIISHVGASVSLDGKPRNRHGHSAFSIFVLAGEHEIRAKLEGYEDAVEKFTIVAGEDQTLRLTLEASPTAHVAERPERLLRDRSALATPADEPPTEELEERTPIVGGVVGQEKKPGLRVMIGAGPVVVLGVASWAPAVGPVVTGSLRPNEYVSLGVEGRAAWLTTGVAERQISAMTAGGLIHVCGHWRWLLGCALGHLGVLNIEAQPTGFKARSNTSFVPGVGARVGARFSFTKNFVTQVGVDVLGLTNGLKVIVGQTVIAEQPPIMIGGHILGGWEF